MAEPLPIVTPELERRLASSQAVLFDLDGTLLDTIELIVASFRHATATVLGRALPDTVLMRNIGIPLRVQMLEFCDDPALADEMLEVYREHNGRAHDEMVCAFPGVEEMLQGLTAMGLPLGVVTSKSRALAERGLAMTGLARHFRVIVTSDDTDIHKPDPYPLAVAADALETELRYCIYVGDSPHDVRAAVDGGAVAVAASWGVSDGPVLIAEGPDIVIGSIADLLPLLSHARTAGAGRDV